MIRLVVFAFAVLVILSESAKTTDPYLDYVMMPGGLRHKSCVYEWPDKTVIGDDSVTLPNGTVVQIPPCRHPTVVSAGNLTRQVSSGSTDYHGWAASAWAYPSSGKEFTYFSAKFNVPTSPNFHTKAEMTYVFNGLEGSAGKYILQPVLQYSNSWTGGNCYPKATKQWGFRSFYVSASGTAHCGSSWSVSEGETVQGIMAMKGEGNWQVWAGGSSDGSDGYSLQATAVKPQQSAQFALELWYPEGCASFPQSPIAFSEAALYQEYKAMTNYFWEVDLDSKAPQCGQNVRVNGPGGVTITSNFKQDPVEGLTVV